ncbi:cytochrome b-c1 complex subunit 9, mitochondrial [Diutina catenulata]
MFSAILNRNSLFVGTVFAGAFAFQGFFDTAITNWYNAHNKGKLWHDVRHKFVESEEDDE